jgi:hypothetical protein
MKKAGFSAVIKKVETNNKVSSNGDTEKVHRVILEIVTIDDDSLIQLQRYPADELMVVTVLPRQMSLQEVLEQDKQKKLIERLKTLLRSFKPILHDESILAYDK